MVIFFPVMQPAPLTIAQKRDYVRRLAEGWKAANIDQAAGARARGEGEKWAVADELQRMSESLANRHYPLSADASLHGMVEQQRLFMKLARRK
jgi:hypothetical protein